MQEYDWKQDLLVDDVEGKLCLLLNGIVFLFIHKLLDADKTVSVNIFGFNDFLELLWTDATTVDGLIQVCEI